MKRINLIGLIAAAVLSLALSSCAKNRIDPSSIVGRQEQRANPTEFDFPDIYEEFHDDPFINFFLNRTYSMGCVPREDMVVASENATACSSIKGVMAQLATQAAAEKRHLDAAFYYRAVEFYTPWNDPMKLSLYDDFITHFYQAVEEDDFELDRIKFGTGGISTMLVSAANENPRGTVVLHGGYDGFKEELYPIIRYIANSGYDVISFDVPWMDRKEGSGTSPFTHEWEYIVGAVLDHYGIEEATLVGFSMGGWLALRAAAFEPRIRRVVASSVSFDVNQYAGWFGQKIAGFSMNRMEEFTNKQLYAQMESDRYYSWFFDQLMHVTQTDSPHAAASVLSTINEENLQSERVTQDVLILTGIEDHAIPLKMHNMQVDALVNAASVRPLVFSEESQGHNHCQFGNLGLALSLIVDWMEEMDES